MSLNPARQALDGPKAPVQARHPATRSPEKPAAKTNRTRYARHRRLKPKLRTGELAFNYCFVPSGQLCAKTRLIRAAGLRWPVEECSSSERTASVWTSRRSGCIPRSPGTRRWSWPPSRSAPSPPPWSATAPASRPRPPRSAAATGSRHDRADSPRDQAPAHRPTHHDQAARTRRPLAHLATPSPGPLPLLPQARTTHPRGRDRPGQLTNGGWSTSEAPPLTSEICGSAGVSLRAGSSWPP